MGTKIEWTDETWNPVHGCTRVSEGCDHCYIERTPPFRMAGMRFDRAGPGSTTGIRLLPERLEQPLRWAKPRRVFVNSLSDLFHEQVPDEFIARAFAVMAAARQHTFQVLTKRPGRMRSLLTSLAWWEGFTDACRGIGHPEAAYVTHELGAGNYDRPWLPNVWLGTSVESQKWAGVRIPPLLNTPAAVRFLSCEPLLGPVELDPWTDYTSVHVADQSEPIATRAYMAGLGWVIAGGESGPRARPMHPDWARSLRNQCVAAGVPFHFKQWGEHDDTGARVGKRAAGRVLDGRTWDEWPTPTGALL